MEQILVRTPAGNTAKDNIYRSLVKLSFYVNNEWSELYDHYVEVGIQNKEEEPVWYYSFDSMPTKLRIHRVEKSDFYYLWAVNNVFVNNVDVAWGNGAPQRVRYSGDDHSKFVNGNTMPDHYPGSILFGISGNVAGDKDLNIKTYHDFGLTQV